MSAELVSRQIDTSFFDKREDTVVTWLGMAGVLINTRGTILFIDPLLTVLTEDGEEVSETGHRFKIALPIEAKDVPKVDAVLYTHADRDHCGAPTAETLSAKFKPAFVAPPPARARLMKMGVSEEQVTTARDWDTIRIGAAEILVTAALHGYPPKGWGWRRGDCCGYIVKTPDGAIWHPGDTRLTEELLDVTGVDVLFFDVAAVAGHLGPQGSSRLAQTCGAKVMIAYHYGTYEMPPGTYGSCDPEDAKHYVEGRLRARLLMPNPGELLRLPLEEATK